MKEEAKKTSKKKEVTCFRCKKVGHNASKCEEALPTKTARNGSNMLITKEDSCGTKSRKNQAMGIIRRKKKLMKILARRAAIMMKTRKPNGH